MNAFHSRVAFPVPMVESAAMTVQPPLPRPPRYPRVPAVLVLVVLVGAFVWGMVMFVMGRRTVVPDQAPTQARDAALAMLSRIDQALQSRDANEAERLIAAANLPETPLWQAALKSRRAQLDAVRVAPAWRFERISAHPRRGEELLAVGRDQVGWALLRSGDAGAHWSDLKRLPAGAGLQRLAGDPECVLVVAPAAERLGWASSDGGATWSEVTWPSPPLEHMRDVHACLTGDGRIVAVVPTGKGHDLCIAARDGTWTSVATSVAIVALAPLASEALVLITAEIEGKRVLRQSGDSGRTFITAAPELQALVGLTVQTVTATDQVRMVFADGRRARFALSDGAFLGLGDL
jgi:hypothetical protein